MAKHNINQIKRQKARRNIFNPYPRLTFLIYLYIKSPYK